MGRADLATGACKTSLQWPARHVVRPAPAAVVQPTGFFRRQLSGFPWISRSKPLYPRRSTHHVPRPPVDDPDLLRVWIGGRNQSALQISARAGEWRTQRCLRSSHPVRLRRGPSHGRRGSRQMRCLNWFTRRHGSPFRRYPAGSDQHLDDHHVHRSHCLGHVHRSCRKAGGCPRQTAGHGAERHPEGIHGAERVDISAASLAAAGARLYRLLQRPSAELEPNQHQRLPHPRSRRDGRPGIGIYAICGPDLCGRGH